MKDHREAEAIRLDSHCIQPVLHQLSDWVLGASASVSCESTASRRRFTESARSSAKAILAKLRAGVVEYTDKERRTIDARTIYRAGWAGLDREATYAGLDLLVDLHYLRRETEATEGRTATFWAVNPEAIK